MKQTYQGRSRQAIGLVAGIAMGCAMLLGAQVPRASAGGPPGATTGTGISIDPNGPRTPAALGYTQAYADAKGAQLAQAINDTSLSGYETRIVYEIDSFPEPLYTRVDVSSPYYVWHQSNYALHATLSVGYWSSGAQVTIGDPYTASTSGCPDGIGYPGYSATPDQGCIYFGYSASSYYRAKSGVVQSELPEQY